jgi:hypothetical protein
VRRERRRRSRTSAPSFSEMSRAGGGGGKDDREEVMEPKNKKLQSSKRHKGFSFSASSPPFKLVNSRSRKILMKLFSQ